MPKQSISGERLGDKTRYGYDGRDSGRRRGAGRSGTLAVRCAVEVPVASSVVLWKGDSAMEVLKFFSRSTGCVMLAVRSEGRCAGRVDDHGRTAVASEITAVGGGLKRRVGTGVDRDRREVRKKEERSGGLGRRVRGTGKRSRRRRHSAERCLGRSSGGDRTRVTRGVNRGYERPVLRRKRGGVEHKVGRGGGDLLESVLPMQTMEAVGRGSRKRLGGGKATRLAKDFPGVVHIRRGAGRWGRGDGVAWLKTTAKREKGREESGKGRAADVRICQHRGNTQGRRSLGRVKGSCV